MERDDNVPPIDDLIRTTSGTSILSARLIHKGISHEQVCRNELEILKKLDWNLHRVTTYAFV